MTTPAPEPRHRRSRSKTLGCLAALVAELEPDGTVREVSRIDGCIK